MKKTTAGLLALTAAAIFAAPAQAQIPNVTPFGFEIRGGAAFPTGEFKEDAEAKTGWTVGGNVSMQIVPLLGLGIYGGYSRSEFGVSDEVIDEFGDGKYVDQGFEGGVRWNIPTPLVPIDPWIKAGAVYHTLSVEGFDEGDFESDRSLGFEVGAGLGLGLLGGKVSLTPGLTYTSYGFEGGDGDDLNLSYLKAEVGLRIRL